MTEYESYRNRIRRLELYGRGLRCLIVATAFRLSLEELVDGGDWLGYALRLWYREQG